METNVIEKYELINGTAILDSYYVFITANEALYQFMGISASYNAYDIIHQVDMEDFIDVTKNLKPGKKKTMVIRMKRVDNSYRWMLMHIEKFCIHIEQEKAKEYLSLQISDILAIENQNKVYKESLIDYSYILALQGGLLFNYNFTTENITFYYYVDNEQITMIQKPFVELSKDYLEKHLVADESVEEFKQFCENVIKGAETFSHQIKACFSRYSKDQQMHEVKCVTVLEGGEPKKVLGSIKNIGNARESYTKNVLQNLFSRELMSEDNIREYIDKNICYNPDSNLSMILIRIDHVEEYREQQGQKFVEDLFFSVIISTKKMLEHRGVLGIYQKDMLCIILKENNMELNIRAFIEALRSSISWNYILMNEDYKITFSIGISRYPFNGNNYEILSKKALRGLEIANKKGKNRYILYKENIHGEI